MLKITIPASELWDETNETFIITKEYTLQLEHSLVSLSKWESKWCKPFLSNKEKTFEETVDYIRCMNTTQNVPSGVFNHLTNDNIEEINSYIGASMTATWFNQSNKGKKNNEQITSELIYYWMISMNIPFECQKWHLSRLLTLIEVIDIKNQPAKKMSKKELMKRNSELNAARRKTANSTG